MNESEINEREPAAIQRELLMLADKVAEVTAELVEAEQAYHEALTNRAVLKAKATMLKQRIQALQSVLKSVSQF